MGDIPHRSPVAAALASRRAALLAVGLFSAIVNLLLLTGPLFMLQIYDRVLTSHSVPTLVALQVLVGVLFAYYVALEIIRGRLLTRIGLAVEQALAPRAFSAALRLPLVAQGPERHIDPLRDLNMVRQFFTGTGPLAVFDMPWLPLYLGIVFLLHPWLGIVATLGAIVLVGLTLVNEAFTRSKLKAATNHYGLSQSMVQAGQRNAEAVRAMGMERVLADRWQAARGDFVASQVNASDVSGGFASGIKGLRLLLQSLILAVGAYLAIGQHVTPGVMIAASIIAARALAPVELAVSNWRNYVETGLAWKRLDPVLAAAPVAMTRFNLPAPSKLLEVSNLTVVPPGAQHAALEDVNVRLEAGEALGVLGRSGAGKSTLARALTGTWTPCTGEIRLDGAALNVWQNCALGRHIGYLPQQVELLEGTVSQNIARFDPEANSESVLKAAELAGVHEIVLGLPDGYDTDIGENGHVLSAGQRQRIGLARALFGQPFLVVLDEPNSNLDAAGEAALIKAIRAARDRGSIVIVMAHRSSVIAACDMALVLDAGRQLVFGPRDGVLRKSLAPGQRTVA